MRDPHVEALHYTLVPDEDVSFTNAPPLEAERPAFTLRLADGHLTVTMREHHASETDAREAVGPFLRAWEIRHALSAGRPEVRFEFERSEVVDRDPPPPGTPQTIYASAAVYGVAGMSARLSVDRGAYPAPPDDFALDPNVETMWRRWEGYVAGREPLQSMAFFCLTVLEMHGGRSGATTRFAISGKVLSTLARLSTEAGDESTARKLTPKLRPLTGDEKAWIEAAIKAMIRRAGEVAAMPATPLPRLTMADLPEL